MCKRLNRKFLLVFLILTAVLAAGLVSCASGDGIVSATVEMNGGNMQDREYNGQKIEFPEVSVWVPEYPYRLTENEHYQVVITRPGTNGDAGYYRIEADLLEGYEDDYTLTGEPARGCTIRPRSVSVVWAEGDAGSCEYDGNVHPTAALSGGGIIGNDSVNLSVTGNGSNAAVYSAKASLDNRNYTISNPEKSFRITPRPITLSSETASKTYDGQAFERPVVTVTAGSFVNNEASAGATGSVTDVSQGEVTNTIVITPANGYLETNYSITKNEGKLYVRAQPVEVVWDTADTFEFNGSEQAPAATARTAQGVTLDLKVSGATSARAEAYLATASLATANSNYTLTNIKKPFYITPKPVVLTWSHTDDLVYTGLAQKPTATYTDVNHQTREASVSGERINAGSQYTATAATGSNYKAESNTVTFSISPAEITITADNKTKTYDSDPNTDPRLTATQDGVPANGEAPDYTLSREEGQDVHDYVIRVEAGDNPNYEVTVKNGVFSITRAPLTITAKDQEYVYNSAARGEDNATYTDGSKVTVTGLRGDDVLTGITLNGRETEAGVYTGRIVPSAAGIGQATDNYTIEYRNGNLAIKPKDVVITAKDAKKTYDGKALTEGGFTAGRLEEGDAHTFTVVMTDDSTITDAGTRKNVIATVDGTAVRTGEATAVGNYTVTTVDGTLTISEPELKLIPTEDQDRKDPANDPGAADGKTNSYDSAAVDKNGKTGKEYGSWLTGELAREAGEAVGDYGNNMGTVKDNTGADNPKSGDDSMQKRPDVPILLTPAYPGMKVLVGYTEPLSGVRASWGGGTADAAVNPWGLFVIRFPEGISDPEITLTVTDAAGNPGEKTVLSVPARGSDVNMTVDANPLGALIRDEIGMVKGVAAPVTPEELEKGPVEIPILAANCFPVGRMTIAQDAETGKVSFTPVIDEAYAAEDPGTYFNVFPKTPTAKELEKETRGTGLDIANGYTPEAGATVFWFVYETRVTLTDRQLTLAEGAEAVDITEDAAFAAYQELAR